MSWLVVVLVVFVLIWAGLLIDTYLDWRANHAPTIELRKRKDKK